MSVYQVQFEREKTALKFFLLGRRYHNTLKALGFVERYHDGLRKDGKTPELHHQVQIALSITQLRDLSNEELCLTAALLHDVQEDAAIPSEVIEQEFGVEVRNVVWKLTKKFAGTHKVKEDYLAAIAGDPIASIVKGVDRCNNLTSMEGVFSAEKKVEYAEEARTLFLPMLKRASKLFPEQQHAYHAVAQLMKLLITKTEQNTAITIEQTKKIADLEGHNNFLADELRAAHSATMARDRRIAEVQGQLQEKTAINDGLKREVATEQRIRATAKAKVFSGMLAQLGKLSKEDMHTAIRNPEWINARLAEFNISQLDFVSNKTIDYSTADIATSRLDR